MNNERTNSWTSKSKPSIKWNLTCTQSKIYNSDPGGLNYIHRLSSDVVAHFENNDLLRGN